MFEVEFGLTDWLCRDDISGDMLLDGIGDTDFELSRM